MLKFSISKLAEEFGVAHETMRRRLNDNSAKPSKDGQYSIRQGHAALSGDLARQRVRVEKAKADKLELELKIQNGQLVEYQVAEKKIMELLLPLKNELDYCADKLCALVNPENPDLAHKVLRRWVSEIRTQMRDESTNKLEAE